MLDHGMSASPWCGLDADGYIRILFLSYTFAYQILFLLYKGNSVLNV